MFNGVKVSLNTDSEREFTFYLKYILDDTNKLKSTNQEFRLHRSYDA